MVFNSEKAFIVWLEECRNYESISVSKFSMLKVTNVINNTLLKGKGTFRSIEEVDMTIEVDGVIKLINIRNRKKLDI